MKHQSIQFAPDRYRIKPELKLRPWKRESEVPIGAITRCKIGTPDIFLIVGATESGVVFMEGTNPSVYQFSRLCDMREYSTDGGKTWEKCGVYE
jgi:hypothetical protein